LKSVRSHGQEAVFPAIIFGSTLVAYAVQDAFLFETTNGLILWWLLLGYISFAYEDSVPKTVLLPPIAQKYGSVISVIMVALVGFSLYAYHYRPLQASAFARQGQLTVSMDDWAGSAEQALSFSVPFRGESAVFLAERFINLAKANVPVSSSLTVAGALRVARVLDEETVFHPDKLAYPMWAGQMYLALGEHSDPRYYEEAERAFLSAAEVAPRRQEVWFFLGRLYLLEKKFAEAIAVQERAVALDPSIRESHWFLGLTYVAAGHTAQGLAEIAKARGLGYALTIDQTLYVIDLYAVEKNFAKVIDLYQQLIAKEPDNVNWYIKLAATYAAAEQKELALETVRQAVRMYPPLRPEAEKFVQENKLGTL
jgi:tetratricopeptide (TPR) repeat protein